MNNTRVFETALSLAQLVNARLLLAHILPCADAESPASCESQGLTMLRKFHAVATQAGIGCDLAQPLANPGHQICELAIGWGSDLIVMGRRDANNDEDLDTSVSHHVTRHAACPVLIVQHHPFGYPDRLEGRHLVTMGQ
ncbi:universal stress protein [Thermocoleostomius sinensis]|uniref:Universal stress protein n=1 Tax=Thermocoleostomius sinensis A174 TaxID=2016057 RepID=A0A9E9CCA8_9CYAN|nr:universal stress protein [Thermocoleostomius sinensis]WAL62420.1 universal stress protein [Thermocoleostomius sinensis A174]